MFLTLKNQPSSPPHPKASQLLSFPSVYFMHLESRDWLALDDKWGRTTVVGQVGGNAKGCILEAENYISDTNCPSKGR